MLSELLSASLALINAGKWNELNRLWTLTERVLDIDQAKLNQAYKIATGSSAKMAAAIKL